ncbi:hypothetical protein PHSY_002103 [Pseudozyma hubeiensis SY62]|uniref:Uncharacterized protein n=1 Tax=Pseudozyma hubeiensis (strain SY62) TaxID=1305764 RepID=R9P083_PSEHS|nr:hypothetical protein PHSY_002103 [Pseudozyma hubeiensis SY62]GAC94531.1 hypothetical protein PHSY_002103 [Pseudozyma hubeiensis SY62]
MTETLLVAGSNSGYQLGVGHDQDVRTLQQALCQIGPDTQDVASFPPIGWSVVDVSSGANHTLALVESDAADRDAPEQGARKEVWIAGTGSQGQLGPAHSTSESRPLKVFTRLDLKACLEDCDGVSPTLLSQVSPEPKRIVCGWNCSYIVLAFGEVDRLDHSRQDVLVSFGLHRDNTFGELGCQPRSPSNTAGLSVHEVSFASALTEAGLDADVPFDIVDVAAGLRHGAAILSVGAKVRHQRRIILVGWGSTRQGQVGRVPERPPKQPGPSKRPGSATATIVSEPQIVFDWSMADNGGFRCKLRAGKDHTVVLLQRSSKEEDIELHSIGSNKQGQLLDTSVLLQHKSALEDVVDVSCNWNGTHCLVHRKDGEQVILSCGNNSRGQFGNAKTTARVEADRLTSTDLTTILQQASSNSTTTSSKTALQKLVSGSEHSLLLVERRPTTVGTPLNDSNGGPIVDRQVWGWGWNEHGNLAQGPHDEADRHCPTLLLDGTRSGAAQQQNAYTPLNIWAGCGTSFLLVESTDNKQIGSAID